MMKWFLSASYVYYCDVSSTKPTNTYLHLFLGSTELSLMKGVQTTAHLLSQSIHNTAVASLVGLHYMEDVHALLMELEKHSLDEWTVGCNNDTVIDDLFYLSCIAVFTIDSTATPSIT